MEDYINVLISDLKKEIDTYKNKIEGLEIKIELSEQIVEKLEKALNQSTNKTDIIE